ncbi:MAG: PHP-associated domain-containing protein [Bacillota bacterium]|nr:PHP-associated domain-containing protein [Bacillota bacterium]
MGKFLYEMHCHTNEVSRCGKVSAAGLIENYYRMGFSGVCITDHDIDASSTISKKLSWDERVTLFEKGYAEAKKKGDELGVDVFFAWEYSYHCGLQYAGGNDFLTYCLDIDWMRNHPEMSLCSLPEYSNAVHADGGVIVHAHPFREEGYIDMIRLNPRIIDAVEVFNAGRTDKENKMAEIYAEVYELPKWAGSDNHVGKMPVYGAVAFDRKMSSLREICDELLAGRGEIIKLQDKDNVGG